MVATLRTDTAEQIDLLADSRQMLLSLSGPECTFASDSENYAQAYFGRDSLEAAEDVLAEMPDLVRPIIRLLCSVQGSRFDAVSE
jgi:hypothetical protein